MQVLRKGFRSTSAELLYKKIRLLMHPTIYSQNYMNKCLKKYFRRLSGLKFAFNFYVIFKSKIFSSFIYTILFFITFHYYYDQQYNCFFDIDKSANFVLCTAKYLPLFFHSEYFFLHTF